MSPAKLLITRPLGIITICLVITGLGLLSVRNAPINLHHKITYPALTITTELFESDPQEVETLITKPLESALSDLPNLKKLQSCSRSGESEITLLFHSGKNTAEAALDVRSRIRRLLPLLPKDAKYPSISRFNPSDAPLMTIAVTGGPSVKSNLHWVKNSLRPTLVGIPGVAAVRISGAPIDEIIIDCDPGRLRAYSLTVHDVAGAVESGHASVPAGIIELDGGRVNVRTVGYLKTPEEIALQPICLASPGTPLLVSDLGKVSVKIQPPDEIVRLGGVQLIAASVFRTSDGDIRRIGAEIKKLMSDTAAKTGFAGKIEIIFDQSKELGKVFYRLYRLIPITAILTGLILYLFMGNVSSTLLILTSIPFSFCLAFMLMRLMGVSLDILSLTGLTLGLGILVDNGIVVIDAISKRRSEGMPLPDGVVSGVREVAVPLFLSVIITTTAFIPVLFISEEIRSYFTGFSWTVLLSLSASLVSALTLIPVLFQRFSAKANRRPYINFDRISTTYRSLFLSANQLFIPLLLFTFIFLIVAAYLGSGLTFRRSASGNTNQLKIYMLMPPAVSVNFTDSKAKEVERILRSLPVVERLYTEVKGSQTLFKVTLSEKALVEDPIALIRSKISNIRAPDGDPAQFHIIPMDAQGIDSTITVRLQGPNHEILSRLADQTRDKIRRIPLVKDVLTHQGNLVPGIDFIVSQHRVGFHNVQTEILAQELRGLLTGPVAARIRDVQSTTQIRVRSARYQSDGLGSVQTAFIPNIRGAMVPLMELAPPEVRLQPTVLLREAGRPIVPMTIASGGDDPLSLGSEIKEALKGITFPAGYIWSFGDEIKDITRIRSEMAYAGVIGLIIIYLILAMATESMLQPFFIMIAVPFAVGSAAIGLRIFGDAVSLPVYMGIIILSGLVININIVMAYTINDMRRRGKNSFDAALGGAQRRLRPILMSLLTATGGTIPMLLERGSGTEMWTPFALTLAVGMPAAVFFSLILMPVLYAKAYARKDLREIEIPSHW